MTTPFIIKPSPNEIARTLYSFLERLTFRILLNEVKRALTIIYIIINNSIKNIEQNSLQLSV